MSVAQGNVVTGYRRRAFVGVIAAAAEALDDPLGHWSRHEAIWDVFDDQDDLVNALQEHWVDLLRHAIYAEASYPLGEQRVTDVYREVTTEYAGLRAVLDSHQDDPALFQALEEERVMLARAAGHLTRSSAANLAWRARDLIEDIPKQRGGERATA